MVAIVVRSRTFRDDGIGVTDTSTFGALDRPTLGLSVEAHMVRRMDAATRSILARKLGSALEPLTGQVYFSPECHRNYAALGFAPSKAKATGVELPDGPAYFTSRGSVMGQVPGEVVAAAFGVFNPEAVVPSVDFGWSITDAETICHARDDGAIAQLVRLIGEAPQGVERANELLDKAVTPLRPEGRPLFSGLRSLEIPEVPVGRMWRLGDMLREFRGDSHINAWTAKGLDATEIGLLTELYWGLPMRTYSRTRAWTDAQFDAVAERLQSEGLIDGTSFTDAGRALRESIEVETDTQMAGVLDRLGDDIDELLAILVPWGADVRAGFGYLSSGPHDLAKKAAPAAL